jgi:hypothetical protein
MDITPATVWFAEAARLTASANALATLGDTTDIAHVRGLNDALEARAAALASPDLGLLDCFMAPPFEGYVGLTPAAPEMVRARYTLRPYASVNTVSTSPRDLLSPEPRSPIQFDAPLTVRSPVSVRDRGSDLTWRIDARHVRRLDDAILRLGTPLTQQGVNLQQAVWAAAHGMSPTVAARKFGAVRSKINVCLRDLYANRVDDAARRICRA